MDAEAAEVDGVRKARESNRSGDDAKRLFSIYIL